MSATSILRMLQNCRGDLAGRAVWFLKEESQRTTARQIGAGQKQSKESTPRCP